MNKFDKAVMSISASENTLLTQKTSTSFKQALSEDPSMREKYPYLYSVLVANEKWRQDDTFESYTNRGVKKRR